MRMVSSHAHTDEQAKALAHYLEKVEEKEDVRINGFDVSCEVTSFQEDSTTYDVCRAFVAGYWRGKDVVWQQRFNAEGTRSGREKLSC